jgi:O-methyltransferase
VKPVLRRLTASIYGHRPLASWPPVLGRLHEISVPRGVIPHSTPLPIGTANINNLISLIEKTRQVPGDLAECGTFRGASLIPMGIYLKQQGIKKRIYSFDSFEGFAPSVTEDLKFGGTHDEWKQPGVMNDTSYELVAEKAKTFDLDNVTLVKGFFETTFPSHAGLTFSYVHLDCDAYSAYRECLTFFYPRLSAGGIISFDEYNDPPWPGCNKAVDEFLSDKPEKLQVIALDNWEKSYFVKQQ